MLRTKSLNSRAVSEAGLAKSTENIVLDNKLIEVSNAARLRPIAVPARQFS